MTGIPYGGWMALELALFITVSRGPDLEGLAKSTERSDLYKSANSLILALSSLLEIILSAIFTAPVGGRLSLSHIAL